MKPNASALFDGLSGSYILTAVVATTNWLCLSCMSTYGINLTNSKYTLIYYNTM